MDAMMKLAKLRRIDAVVCWRLDRFPRSLRHLVNALAELEAVGVAFISLRDNSDLSTPSGRLMFQIIAAMSELERTLTVERVRAGLAHARNSGKMLGRPKIDRKHDKDAVDPIRVMNEKACSRSLSKL